MGDNIEYLISYMVFKIFLRVFHMNEWKDEYVDEWVYEWMNAVGLVYLFFSLKLTGCTINVSLYGEI